MQKLTLLFAILFLVGTLSAQGTISGTVIDEDSAEPVMFANITLPGTEPLVGGQTDLDGKFQLTVPAGTYTLTISYVGYPTKTIEGIAVADGEITYQDIVLSEAGGVELDEVVVTAKVIEVSEIAMLIARKNADVVSDAISAQEMTRYGASDATGALQKVTGTNIQNGKYVFIRGLGDRYSLSQLNGLVIPSTNPYRNSAQLDLIPTNLLDNIMTAKTFSPDQPGNFTGGNIDIRTKSFPEQASLTISVTGGFNSQSNLINNFLTHQGGTDDYWGYDNGRGLPSELSDPEIRPLLVPASEGASRRNGDQRAANALDAAAKSIIPQVRPTQRSVPLDHGFSFSFGNKYQLFGNDLGVIATASFRQDYQNLDNFNVANWEVLSLTEDSLRNIGNFRTNQSILNPTTAGLIGLAYRLGQYSEINFNAIYNHTTEKLSRTVQGTRPDNILAPRSVQGFQLSFTEQELINYQLGGTHVIPGLNQAKIEWRTSYVNSSQYEPQTRFFENTFNTETGSYGFGGADLNDPFYFWRDLQDEQLTAKLDLTIPFAGKGNKIKIGGMLNYKDRESTEERFRLENTSSAQSLNELEGDQNAFVGLDNVGIVGTRENGGILIGNYLRDQTLPANSYTGREDISAAYAMVNYNLLPNLKFVGGARMEVTDIEVLSQDTSLMPGVINETDLLPSANLIYELVEDMNIRASYSRTLARPNMREISPFTIVDPIVSRFERGNPNLERSLIDNFDLRWEYFFGRNEVVALSGYYKNFQNPIVRQFLISTNNEIQFINVDNGQLYGIEVEFRKNLGFLAPFLTNFNLNTNATYIQSETDTDALNTIDPATRPFEGQPDYIINAALNYVNSKRGWDASLSLNYLGDRLNSIGSATTLDIYDVGRTQLDINIIKRIGDLTLRLGARNLLDDPFLQSSTFRGDEYIYSDFRRGVDWRFGIGYTIR